MKKNKRHTQILQAIEEAGGTYPVVDNLAKQIEISESYASRLLGSLENEGLIIRELQKDQEYSISLTPEGKKYLMDPEVGPLSFIEEENENLKDIFLRYLDTLQAESEAYPVGMTEPEFAFILGRLWDDAEPLPTEYCDQLGLAHSSAYADAARTVVATKFWGLIDLTNDEGQSTSSASPAAQGEAR